MIQLYTIHKFIRNKLFKAPYNSLSVEETKYYSIHPVELYYECVRLAQLHLSEIHAADPSTKYSLLLDRYTVVFRPVDSIENVGNYPGLELLDEGDERYAIAWLVVPVLNNEEINEEAS